ncbi:MAG TPA: hypothetical protein DCP90_03090 [Clostridiales bacterium]|nr:MAG: hypothetical protein A2Y22_07435 [Clostridiales bacterium GWD2_32_59]HAN09580.1 hypothetical protein [Clostridiales bacterium]
MKFSLLDFAVIREVRKTMAKARKFYILGCATFILLCITFSTAGGLLLAFNSNVLWGSLVLIFGIVTLIPTAILGLLKYNNMFTSSYIKIYNKMCENPLNENYYEGEKISEEEANRIFIAKAKLKGTTSGTSISKEQKRKDIIIVSIFFIVFAALIVVGIIWGMVPVVIFFILLTVIVILFAKSQNKKETREKLVFKLKYGKNEQNPCNYYGCDFEYIPKQNLANVVDIITNHKYNGDIPLEVEKISNLLQVILDNGYMVGFDWKNDSAVSDIVGRFNSLINNLEYAITITINDTTNNDDEQIKNRRIDNFSVLEHDLNVIAEILRKQGYELVNLTVGSDFFAIAIIPSEKVNNFKQLTIIESEI